MSPAPRSRRAFRRRRCSTPRNRLTPPSTICAGGSRNSSPKSRRSVIPGRGPLPASPESIITIRIVLDRRWLWIPDSRCAASGMTISPLRARQLAQRGLRRGEPRDRHPERRARYVVELDLVAERDRRRIAAMLTANPELEVSPRFAATLGSDTDEFADAVAVDRHEGIGRQDALRGINTEETRGVVAADAEGRLRQIVGAERKEFRGLRNLAGLERRARQFDHGADLIFELGLGLGRDFSRRGVDALLDQIEFGLAGDQRHHDFRRDRLAGFAAHFGSGFEDGT